MLDFKDMNGIFTLGWNDVTKGLITAVLVGAFLPLSAAIQTPNFNIATANWHQVLVLAVNGAIVGFVGYLAKNLLTDSNGKFLGRI